MDDATITFVVLGAAVALFVLDRLPVAVVALCVALSLWATGVLDLEPGTGVAVHATCFTPGLAP